MICEIEPKSGASYQVIDLIVSGGTPFGPNGPDGVGPNSDDGQLYDYSWVYYDGLLNSSPSQEDVFNAESGAYAVMVWDSEGCSEVLYLDVEESIELTTEPSCEAGCCPIEVRIITDECSTDLQWELALSNSCDAFSTMFYTGSGPNAPNSESIIIATETSLYLLFQKPYKAL